MSSSKNLIYTCCFHQEAYTDVVANLIESFTQSGSSSDFLVYTTTEYKEIIQKKCAASATNVAFFEKNFYKTMNQARISKLDIFDFPFVDKYDKILYLDADSILMKNPDPIFDQIVEDVVYTVGEGTILNEGEYWGRSLFLKDDAQSTDHEGLGAYALGFKNIPAVKKIFIKMKQSFYLDMYQNKLRFYDQPFLNFYLIKNSMCDTNVLKSFVRSRPSAASAVSEGTTVVHFAGCPGHSDIKLGLIREFKADYEKIRPQANTRAETLRQELSGLRQRIAEIENELASLA